MPSMLWPLAALGLVFGLGAREVKRFERLAAEDIASTLEGTSKNVRVKSELNGFIGGALGDLKRVTISARSFSTPGLPLFTEPDLAASGKVRELRIELDDFVLGNLRVEHLEATIPDCRFDYNLAVRKRKIRLSRSGTGIGRVKLLERDLEAFILKKFREIKRVSVKIEKDRAFVSGYGEFLVIHTDFDVIARLAPVDGTKLMLTDAKVFFGERLGDQAVRDIVVQTLNPVVDLDKDLNLYGAIQVEGLSLQNGVLEAWGQTKIPDRPKGLTNAYYGNLFFRDSKALRTISVGMFAVL